VSENFEAIRGALSMIGVANKTATASNVVPTAKTRGALDYLVSSTLDDLMNPALDVREISESLFNWSGSPKATKSVMKAFGDALQVPGKYSHAVELAAYVAALAPLLEPDRLARLFGAINEVSTAFAPARYTLQLANKLEWILKPYPEERREKLAYSLWVEAHTGRWWDLTAGVDVAAGGEAPEPLPEDELLTLFESMKLPWTPETAEQFARIPETDAIRDTLAAYNNALLRDKMVDPDTAVLASHIPWLKPMERPESPVGGLLETMRDIHNELQYELPKKPQTFSSLFPDIKLYGGTQFPFPNSVLLASGRLLVDNVSMEVVKDATQLADNRTYMGNCTWSYKGRMEKGEYVLFRLHNGGEIYNASMTLYKNRWAVGEVNARFNRGNVPNKVRDAFARFVAAVPEVKADNELTKNRENYQKIQDFKNRKYRYKI